MTAAFPDYITDRLAELRLRAHAPGSKYRAAALLETDQGEFIPGVNVEFEGAALSETIHAEQAALAVAHARGVSHVRRIYLSAAPCGHCRQFLFELEDAAGLEICIPGQEARRLDYYLPEAFSAKDFGLQAGLLTGPRQNLSFEKSSFDSDGAAAAALEMACRSYAPYTGAFSGAALETRAQRIYCSAYLENAAMNPSLAPFQGAVANMIASGEAGLGDIRRVTLVYAPGASVSCLASAQMLLKTIPHPCEFRALPAFLTE